MKRLLLVLVLLAHDALTSPSLLDNKLGQPEEVSSLGLPSDEESFNRLNVLFNPGRPPSSVGSGTYHFVSSTFPEEVDARGFHESVFDGIGDYFPSWPAPYKRGDSIPLTPSLAQRLGLQPHNKFRKRSEPWTEQSLSERTKRSIQPNNSSQDTETVQNHADYGVGNVCTHGVESKHLGKREAATNNEGGGDTLEKRSGARHGRGMEMGSSGFHGDVFNGDFGDFTTMRKRLKGSLGFHGDTFSDGFGDFATMKKSLKKKRLLTKLKDYLWRMTENDGITPDHELSKTSLPYTEDEEINDFDDLNDLENGKSSLDLGGDMSNIPFGESYPVRKRMAMGSSGFHGDTFSQGFGDFNTYKKRRPNSGSMGFHGDTFSQGFGDFDTFKKRKPNSGSMGFHGDTFSQGFGDFDTLKKRGPNSGSMGFHGDTFSQGFGDFDTLKKRYAMGSSGFHGDTFSQGFGDFNTFKKRKPNSGSMGFHSDAFNQGFGDFDTMKKRYAMGSSGFHGDTFSQGFGDFNTFKKRRPNGGSMGFHGDTFNQGFGDFDPMKKRYAMGSSGFHGDTFSQGFGDFNTFKKRRPNGGSMGFHGDTFSQGFGDFDTLKKRRPEMDSMGFHGDAFSRGFGDFGVYKKRSQEEVLSENSNSQRHQEEEGH